tara:strand:+ start:865 stop:1548 length:684 start_codon:yes stop_codon:yes gene_type:complete
MIHAKARDLISCDCKGVVMPEEPQQSLIQESGDFDSNNSVSESNLELANRLIVRLKPEDNSSIFGMIANKSYYSGGLMTIILVFWWLAVDSASDDLNSGLSTFFDLDFSQVALAVIGLGLMSSLLSDLSRELGKLLPSLISGAMLIMCGLYVIEPLAIGLLTEQYELMDGLWRSLRLGILWAGVSWCAHLLVDASLLVWLKRFCDSNGIEITPSNDSIKSSETSNEA